MCCCCVLDIVYAVVKCAGHTVSAVVVSVLDIEFVLLLLSVLDTEFVLLLLSVLDIEFVLLLCLGHSLCCC